jgi:histidinol phosphatase-like PHP family hydrolase
VLNTGTSPTIEAAIGGSGQKADIERRRDLRGNFLSRAQVLAALRNQKLHGLTREQYRGDLQMHSTYSDGSQTLRDIIEAGIALGYEYNAVTDHSYGLPIARGVSMERLATQHQEIDRLNKEFRGRFCLLKGIEANIRADGSVDMTPDELARIEIVVASPHSQLRTKEDQTSRMERAVTTPGVHILGHPRGRMYGSRPGVTAKWRKVFEAAAASGVAIEIDGDPARQDIDCDLAKTAIESGCLFAVDSDAHSTRELKAYTDIAIAHARLAGVPTERIINCWPLRKLLKWAPRTIDRLRPVITRWFNPVARSSLATISGKSVENRHSSARPPADSTCVRHCSHHRATPFANGSTISRPVPPACA